MGRKSSSSSTHGPSRQGRGNSKRHKAREISIEQVGRPESAIDQDGNVEENVLLKIEVPLAMWVSGFPCAYIPPTNSRLDKLRILIIAILAAAQEKSLPASA